MIIKPDLPANIFNRIPSSQPAGVNDAKDAVSEEKETDASSATLSLTAKNRTAAENLKASESSIQDREKAKEVMAYARENILSQTSNALEAQANQLPQSVLTLLK